MERRCIEKSEHLPRTSCVIRGPDKVAVPWSVRDRLYDQFTEIKPRIYIRMNRGSTKS